MIADSTIREISEIRGFSSLVAAVRLRWVFRG
jgi:hypothetical protein